MHLLILGGTAFLGRAVAKAALPQGIRVTCAARGSAPAPDGVDFVQIDRDEDDGLAPLRDRTWDAVVDVSRHPGQVRRAIRDLDTDHWVYISSASVYADSPEIDRHESAGLVAPLEGDVMTDMSEYGAAKVACEQAYRATGQATIVRAGLIGGPGDATGRSGYYPWRFANPTGPDVLVPPDLDAPISLIDVDDLAEFLVLMAEEQIDKTMNATGTTMTLSTVLDIARAASDSSAAIRPVPAEILEEAGVQPWMGDPSLPLWTGDPASQSSSTLSSARALTYGLSTRPVEDTLRRALGYEDTRTSPRGAGLTDDEEIQLRSQVDAQP